MKKLWYVYILSHPDKVSDTGKPLPGKSCNFNRRLAQYKSQFAESGIEPIMTPVTIFDTEEEAFEYEQDLREQHGWKREQPLDQQRKWRQKGSEASASDDARKKNSDSMIKTSKLPKVIHAKRIAQCDFYKITLYDGTWFIVLGSREGEQMLKDLGYNISHKSIHNYANYNVESGDTTYLTKKGKYPRILIQHSTYDEYIKYKK